MPPVGVSNPPSATIAVPEIYEARSLARKAITRAISSGRPMRPNIDNLWQASTTRSGFSSSEAAQRSMGVSIAPGQTQLTRILSAAKSSAIERCSKRPSWQRVLADHIRHRIALRRHGLHRPDHHDGPAAAPDHVRDGVLGCQERAAHIGVQRFVPFRVRRCDGRAITLDAGDVCQNIDATHARGYLVYGLLDLGANREIHVEGLGGGDPRPSMHR